MRSLRSTLATAALTMTTANRSPCSTPILEPTTQKFIDGLAGGKPHSTR